MKLVIFGATGLTGQHVLSQALDRGHDVTAFVRQPSSLATRHERLKVIQGDVVADPDKVRDAVAGQDAVLCVLGAKNTPETTVLSHGTRNIVAAMKATGVRRLIVQSSLGAGDSYSQGGIYSRVIAPLFVKHVFADKAVQEQIVKESDLDWTIVRPPRLTNGPHTKVYRAGLNLHLSAFFAKISRADVADFLLNQVTDRTYLHQCPAVGY